VAVFVSDWSAYLNPFFPLPKSPLFPLYESGRQIVLDLASFLLGGKGGYYG